MSSGITFSGFNSVDFGMVINALMMQAEQPLTNLQSRQTTLKSQLSYFSQLETKVSAVQSAAEALSSTSTLASYATTVSDSSILSASASATSVSGHYDIVVQELARAQVTASASTSPDADTTTVADGGSLTINGTTVSLTGALTLQGLAETINDTVGIGAQASVVQTGTGEFRLVLTGVSTGAANSFTVQNNLTGGTGVTFTDTDADGTSGDSAADNAVQATDASLLVNNIAVSSASNTVSAAVPGTTLTLLSKSPGTTVSLDVSSDASALQGKVEAFVSAYNALQKFATDQGLAAAGGNAASIARNPLLRTLRNELRSALNTQYGTDTISYVSQMGIEFTRTGTLQFNETKFTAALANGTTALDSLLNGTGNGDGAFGAITALMERYTESAGIIDQAQDRLNKQISNLDIQMADMQRRLDLQRAALVREYTAADQAMSRLKGQSGALSAFGDSSSSSTSTSLSS